MAKSCSQCGGENNDTAKFCKQCAHPMRLDSASRCAKGHIIPPGATKCAICEADKMVTQYEDKSNDGASGVGPSPVSPYPNSGASKRPPAPGPGMNSVARPSISRSSTMVLAPIVPGTKSSPEAAKLRKIVGVLMTYSTKPEGEIFPVREGRNRIGRNPDNEICVPDDDAMSGVNSFIIFHPQAMTEFLIDDANSQNGTFVNGDMVFQRQTLDNYSDIRAGSTVFTFLAAKSVLMMAEDAVEDSAKERSHGTDVSRM